MNQPNHISPVGPQAERKAIVIGECFLEIAFGGTEPAGASAGGTLLRAACQAARRGLAVTMVGETGHDRAGQIIVRQLKDSGVDTRSVDLFTEGTSASHLVFDNPADTIAYGTWPKEPMSVIWPRIDAGDIVVYGGTYVLEQRVRPQVTDILRYARDRRATVVYVPAFSPWLAHRKTHYMPAVLENLESCDLAVMFPSDLKLLFGHDVPEEAFQERVRFHTDRMMSISAPAVELFGLQGLHASAPAKSTGLDLGLAALIETLIKSDIDSKTLATADKDAFQALTSGVASLI